MEKGSEQSGNFEILAHKLEEKRAERRGLDSSQSTVSAPANSRRIGRFSRLALGALALLSTVSPVIAGWLSKSSDNKSNLDPQISLNITIVPKSPSVVDPREGMGKDVSDGYIPEPPKNP